MKDAKPIKCVESSKKKKKVKSEINVLKTNPASVFINHCMCCNDVYSEAGLHVGG